MHTTKPRTSRLEQIVAILPDETLVANMEKLSATFDSLAAEKLDVNDPSLAKDRALYAAMRTVWRERSGEII